jgi:hypothetical protein
VREKVQRWALTFSMHLMQPLARLIGRVKHGLTPWRRRGGTALIAPWPRTDTIWSEGWRAPEAWAEHLESSLRRNGAIVARGGELDLWDLHVRGGLFGAVRGLLAIEEHGSGKQQLRLWLRPRTSWPIIGAAAATAMLGVLSFTDAAWLAGGVLLTLALSIVAFAVRDCARAAGCWIDAVRSVRADG